MDDLKKDFIHNRKFGLAKDHYTATGYDNFKAFAFSIRDRLIERWILTQQRYHDENCKRVYYLSMEFLIGRLLANNILNLGLIGESDQAMSEMGLNLDDLFEQEVDAGLGNGGLGRLAACFLDSMATLGIPAIGYGIRYDYGIFKQKIVNGYQVELPDEWLALGNPWEFERPEYTIRVKLYGKVTKKKNKKGETVRKWTDTHDVLAVAYDMPVPGYKNDVVNNLRLWSARSTEEFDLEYFNDGDYIKACENKISSENISRVLYPNDDMLQGKELRLQQEYFFTSASIQDIIRRFKMHNPDFSNFPDKVAIQLNDTHPAIGIVELMRILIDEEGLGWDEAWSLTRKTFAYTNHTIMSEALEAWTVSLFEKMLPRHLEIIYNINTNFLKQVVAKYPQNPGKLRSMSLIEEGHEKKIRMSNLCIVGSHSVNGVSQLHTELLKTTLFKDFYEFYPEKFNSKTNGITQRRWLKKCNRPLSRLITENIGEGWVKKLTELKKLEEFAQDASFRERWDAVKKENKIVLSEYIQDSVGVTVDPGAIFDVQIKRFHEYKRQVLFALYLISEYIQIKNDPGRDSHPRTAIISGKAAPGYAMAKLVIKFINNIAAVINSDPSMNDKLKVVFLPDYRVSLAEKIFPASDLSEQISTAGREASGTGNMKFMLNGAVTIGTYDGANIEIAQEVGPENIFIFGLKADEAAKLHREGYNPKGYLNEDPLLKEVMHLVAADYFSRSEKGIFAPLVRHLTDKDSFMVFADFADYARAQAEVSQAYKDKERWTAMSIKNTANAGKFSSDRTIAEYARDIWKI